MVLVNPVKIRHSFLKREILKPGRDANNTYLHGVVIKITCQKRYGLSTENYSTVKLNRSH